MAVNLDAQEENIERVKQHPPPRANVFGVADAMGLECGVPI